MIRTENQKQLSELIVQALSDESIKLAEPLNDFEIQVFSATIDRLLTEDTLPELSELAIEPRRIITLLQTDKLSAAHERQARQTLRRFKEVIINLSAEPELKVLN